MPDLLRLDTLRRGASRIRRTPDRLLHPRRRARALERVAALQPTSALVVCRGNICRSPFGEHYLAQLLGSDSGFAVGSAGFLTSGRPAPPDAVNAAAEFSLDLSGHRAVEMNGEVVWSAEMILVMEPWHADVVRNAYGAEEKRIFLLGDFDPGRIERRPIRDPVCRGLDAFRICYRRMARCLQLLATRLQANGGPDDSDGAFLETTRASSG